MADINIFSMQARILSLLDETTNHEIRELRTNKLESKTFFSDVLTKFIRFQFTEEQAIFYWEEILKTYDIIQKDLGRNTTIYTAIVDYFTHYRNIFNSPLLIEQNDFLKTEKLAMIDSLTGVFNRRYMDSYLMKEIKRCERYKKNCALSLIDIDNFKRINDTHGHQVGDNILQELAIKTKCSIREEDIVCRYGGEEFLIILPETCLNGATILLQRVKETIESSNLLKNYKITLSAGIASYPENGKTASDLIFRADQALYKAKASGKNRIETAIPKNSYFI